MSAKPTWLEGAGYDPASRPVAREAIIKLQQWSVYLLEPEEKDAIERLVGPLERAAE